MSETTASAPTPPLLRNIIFNVGARGVLIVLSIAITPVLVHRLGTEQYGIYALATLLGSGLINVFALGLIPGIVAMLSRSLGERNDADTQKVISTAITLFTCVGVVAAACLALAVPFLVHDLLRIPAALQGVAATALWITAAGLGLNVAFAVFNTVPYALQRYDIIASRLVGIALLSMAATLAYVLVYPNLTGVVVIQVTGGLLGLLVYYGVSRRQLPNIRFVPGFDRSTFVRLARFGAFKWPGDIALTFSSRFDQFAIGSILNVGAVGLYAVPASACQRILQLLGEVAAPMFPRMSSVKTEDERNAVLIRGTRLVALPAALIAVTLIVLAEPILRIWIGGNQGITVASQASGVLRLLAGAMFIQAVVVVAGLYCEAIQRPVVNNSFTVLGAIVQIPLTLLLTAAMGITGAALGVLIASVTQSVPFLLLMAGRVAHVPIRRLLLDGLAGPTIAALFAGLVGLALGRFASNFVSLAAIFMVIAAAYAVTAAVSGAVRASDLEQLQKAAPVRLQTLPGYQFLNSRLRP